MRVVTVPQLLDNYAYLLIDEASGDAGVVDCADAEPVLAAADTEGARLRAILPTHHHADHVAGHEELLAIHPDLAVYGADERIPGLTNRVGDGDSVVIGHTHGQVVAIPAHTTGHVAYYFEGAVFTGDTLFAAGCGRLFEGDAATMLRSLSRLAALPDDTRVYFGHEYTERNLRFALTVEPDNAAVRRKLEWAAAQQRGGGITTPTTIADEKATNPFLRWHSPGLRRTLRARFPDLPLDDVAVFAKTRELKDVF